MKAYKNMFGIVIALAYALAIVNVCSAIEKIVLITFVSGLAGLVKAVLLIAGATILLLLVLSKANLNDKKVLVIVSTALIIAGSLVAGILLVIALNNLEIINLKLKSKQYCDGCCDYCEDPECEAREHEDCCCCEHHHEEEKDDEENDNEKKYFEELARMENMKDSDLISEEEFEILKENLMNKYDI